MAAIRRARLTGAVSLIHEPSGGPPSSRRLRVALCAAAALLGPAAAAAQASPSPGDIATRRALDEVVRADLSASWVGRVLFDVGEEGARALPALARRQAALRERTGAAARRMRRAVPTSPQGRRMRRLGMEVALLDRELGRVTVELRRAEVAGAKERAARLFVRALDVAGESDDRLTAARRIVLPDPAAYVETITVVGGVSGAADDNPAEAPILAPAGGTMTRCAPSDAFVGWRLFAYGVHGASLLRVATTDPAGAVTRSITRIDADNDGQEVTPAVKARGDGVYRLSIVQGARVLADVAVTRACARRAR